METNNPSKEFYISFSSWLRGALVVILVLALFQVSQLILVLLTAIIIASAIEPIAIWAHRRGFPRVPSVIAVYLGAAIALSGFFYFLLLPLIEEVSGFIRTLTIYSNAIVNDSLLSGMFTTQHVFGDLNTPQVVGQISTYLGTFSDFLSQGVFGTASVVFGGMVSLVMIIVLSFYLAVQEDGIGKFLKIIVPLNREKYAIDLWKRSQLKIGYWMQGQLLLGVLVGFLVYVGLIIVGVPNALLFAVLAAIFELIPLFGPVLAAIPAIFATYAALGMTPALIVLAIYLVIQQLENHVIYPMVVKKVVGVPPMVSIIALFIGGQLAGFLGVIIAVPLAAVFMELLSDLEKSKHHQLS
jgi:predicted PurR-regulated permease PerM